MPKSVTEKERELSDFVRSARGEVDDFTATFATIFAVIVGAGLSKMWDQLSLFSKIAGVFVVAAIFFGGIALHILGERCLYATEDEHDSEFDAQLRCPACGYSFTVRKSEADSYPASSDLPGSG